MPRRSKMSRKMAALAMRGATTGTNKTVRSAERPLIFGEINAARASEITKFAGTYHNTNTNVLRKTCQNSGSVLNSRRKLASPTYLASPISG